MKTRTYLLPSHMVEQSIWSNHLDPKQAALVDRIRSFRNLGEGWHYGDGRGATESAIRSALEIQSNFIRYGARKIEAFPDPDGGILISGYHEEHTIEVFCTDDGRMNILHERDDCALYEKNDVTLDELIDYLGGLQWSLKNSFVSFIPNTTVMRNKGLQVWRSEILQEEACRSLTRNVPEKQVEQNANIYGVSIPVWQGVLQFSGGLTHPAYQNVDWPTKRRRLATSVM